MKRRRAGDLEEERAAFAGRSDVKAAAGPDGREVAVGADQISMYELHGRAPRRISRMEKLGGAHPASPAVEVFGLRGAVDACGEPAFDAVRCAFDPPVPRDEVAGHKIAATGGER